LIVPANKIIAGRNYKTGRKIRVKEYTFPERIIESRIDTPKEKQNERIVQSQREKDD